MCQEFLTTKNKIAEIHNHFPTAIYKIFLEEDKKNIKKHISKIKKEHKLNRNDSLNVDTSHNVYDLVDDIFFKPLLNTFLKHSKLFLKELGYDNDFLNRCFLESSWFNISYKNDSLAKHIHPGSIISGVFYIESNSNDNIYFHKTDDMILPPSNPNFLSTKYVTYPCTEDQLLIFKSNLNHSTGVKKEGKKLVISFNIGYK